MLPRGSLSTSRVVCGLRRRADNDHFLDLERSSLIIGKHNCFMDPYNAVPSDEVGDAISSPGTAWQRFLKQKFSSHTSDFHNFEVNFAH